MRNSGSTTKCIREYFAQPVIYDKATSIDFYFTSININTIHDCVEFCAGRQFCRTAVYNTLTRTCAISYEFTQNCRYSHPRYTDYELPANSDSNLVQLACITKCENDDLKRQQQHDKVPIKLITGVPQGPLHVFDKAKHSHDAPTPSPNQKVQIVTGIPHDGFDLPTVYPSTATTMGKFANVNHLARDDPTQHRVVGPYRSRSQYLNQLTIDNISLPGQGVPYIETLPARDNANEVSKTGGGF
ncbi:hypothetical protein WR25_24945 isoform A [Diploscapter pachys]|uniref:Apple domain-containing protein n=1 Tax=Diploscapter pachys TaxID=2018661 RepID=A0A2A2J2E2_9BILA|nr:hypothetical protein WR25_24945 isoform A [Diploscapter pachys]